MARISEKYTDLTHQLRNAAIAVASTPGWVGPTQAELETMATSISNSSLAVSNLLVELSVARSQKQMHIDAGRELMKRVDHLTTALFGKGADEKHRFGLEPEDIVRNRPPAPGPPTGLSLKDAPEGILARWKGIHKSSYEIQWFADAALQQLLGSLISTRQKALISGLEAGTEVFVRVRTTIGGRTSPWSETVRRFVND